MDWIYQGLKFNPDEPFTYEKYGKEWYGFVYVITNRALNKKYIGKKFFWSKKTLPPLKGKKRKRRSIIESNWRDYYGSSANLMEDVETQGKDMLTLAISDHLSTFGIAVASPIILGIVGFLLKLYSTIRLHSKQLEAHDKRISSVMHSVGKMEDKQYSIVQKIPPS